MSRLTEWIGAHFISERAVRVEAWALGGRHLGDVLAGARLELAQPGIAPARRALLMAVARSHKGKATAPARRP